MFSRLHKGSKRLMRKVPKTKHFFTIKIIGILVVIMSIVGFTTYRVTHPSVSFDTLCDHFPKGGISNDFFADAERIDARILYTCYVPGSDTSITGHSDSPELEGCLRQPFMTAMIEISPKEPPKNGLPHAILWVKNGKVETCHY